MEHQEIIERLDAIKHMLKVGIFTPLQVTDEVNKLKEDIKSSD